MANGTTSPQALAEIELESLSDTERKGLETFRWWLLSPCALHSLSRA
jgi:hypothetical protein